MTFLQAMQKHLRKEGESLQAFRAELKKLDDVDRSDLHRYFNDQGIEVEAPKAS